MKDQDLRDLKEDHKRRKRDQWARALGLMLVMTMLLLCCFMMVKACGL